MPLYIVSSMTLMLKALARLKDLKATFLFRPPSLFNLFLTDFSHLTGFPSSIGMNVNRYFLECYRFETCFFSLSFSLSANSRLFTTAETVRITSISSLLIFSSSIAGKWRQNVVVLERPLTFRLRRSSVAV